MEALEGRRPPWKDTFSATPGKLCSPIVKAPAEVTCTLPEAQARSPVRRKDSLRFPHLLHLSLSQVTDTASILLWPGRASRSNTGHPVKSKLR